MTYLNLINKIYKDDQSIRESFLKETKELGIEINNFEEIDSIKKYSAEYVSLVSHNIEKFKHLGSIDLIIYSLGNYKNDKAFDWLTKTWLDLIQNSPIYNSNARDYYKNFSDVTGQKLSEDVDNYILELKNIAIWNTFQVLSLCTPYNKLTELYLYTNKYDIDRVTESLIFLSENGFKDEVVTRIINEIAPLISKDEKYKNVFIYLSKNIISKKFISYLEIIASNASKKASAEALKIINSKKYR